MKKYNAKIIEIEPGTRDGDVVLDMYMKIKIEDKQFWVFSPKETGMARQPMLTMGEKIPLYLDLIETYLEKIRDKKRSFSPKAGNTNGDCHLLGEVYRKEPFPFSSLFPHDREKFENILVDCGIVVAISTEKNKFKIGDYVEADGRLYARLCGKWNKKHLVI